MSRLYPGTSILVPPGRSPRLAGQPKLVLRVPAICPSARILSRRRDLINEAAAALHRYPSGGAAKQWRISTSYPYLERSGSLLRDCFVHATLCRRGFWV